MRSPSSSAGITKPWVEFMLTDYESRKIPSTTVTVNKFTIKNATKPGESFNAELILLDVEALLSSDGQSADIRQNKEYHLVVKFLTKDPLTCEVIKRCGYHIKELKMYSEVVRELNDFQATHASDKYRLFLPEFIYGKCTEKEYVLVMENVKVLGYETNPKQEGLSFEHAMVAVDHVARLHAVSYSYDKTHNFLEKFPCFQFSTAISTFFKPVVWASLANVITFLKSQKMYEDMVKKLETGRTTLPVKFAALWDDQTRHRFLALTHGDFWNSNLMYRHDESHNIESLKLIDWQIAQWNNPVFDLHYLLNTSTSFEMRRDHAEEILRHYHTTFTTATSTMGTPVPNWNYEQFKAEFERTSLVGFLMGMCLIQGTLSKAGENINRGGSACCPSSCWLTDKIKSGFAKVVVSLAFKPSSSYIMRASIKKVLSPIGQELVEGSNELLNSRLLDLLLEADEKGVLDVLSL
uniref:CHK kinase-like domain-containing protein n=2 Tax=Scylla TaxID=6760 RepID=A0A0P4WGL7_SCYOL